MHLGILRIAGGHYEGFQIYICGKANHEHTVCWTMAFFVLHNFLVNNESNNLWQLEVVELQEQQRGEGNFKEEDIEQLLYLESKNIADAEWPNKMQCYFNIN
ncbi:hypothetical protein HOY82DRAFT_541989 [Tuber indicum]|nr:hypothetical protein HOY82DRAFT_541989 [Tuber indicum]